MFISSFYTNPWMHTSGDTLERVNISFFLRSARALIGLMVKMARE
jgi:hypothetical protein